MFINWNCSMHTITHSNYMLIYIWMQKYDSSHGDAHLQACIGLLDGKPRTKRLLSAQQYSRKPTSEKNYKFHRFSGFSHCFVRSYNACCVVIGMQIAYSWWMLLPIRKNQQLNFNVKQIADGGWKKRAKKSRKYFDEQCSIANESLVIQISRKTVSFEGLRFL